MQPVQQMGPSQSGIDDREGRDQPPAADKPEAIAPDARPDPGAHGAAVSGFLRGLGPTQAALNGPWRVAVADESMRPAIEPGDWLLVDPTTRRWPRRGTIVVFREPGSELLAIKRVAGRPGDVVPQVKVTSPDSGQEVVVSIRLTPDEAWVVGDAADRSVDSRLYGPVGVERLVGRVWFRYGPLRRFGRLGKAAR